MDSEIEWRLFRMKSSYNTLSRNYALAVKQIQMLEKMNKQMFNDNHKANERIMELEEENRRLRQGMWSYPIKVDEERTA